MSKHYSKMTLAIAAVSFALTTVAFAANEPSAEVRAWFTSSYTDRAPTGLTESARISMAKKLADFAEKNQGDRSMRDKVLYAADRAYEFGNRDYPEGYGAAARGLMVMQRIDRGGRLEATERLAKMMEGVWAENRRQRLGAGIEYAQVKMQVAQQRLSDLFVHAAFETPEKSKVVQTITHCKRDYIAAYGAANTVLTAAARYRTTVKGEKAQAALDDFFERHGDMRDRIRENQKKLGEFNRDYVAVGADAFPAPIVDPKEALASALGKDKPTEPTSEPEPTTEPEPTRPPVASVDPEPEPEPEPTIEPDPTPTPPSTRTGPRKRKTVWQQINCTNCGEGFVPEFGSEHKTCYWCRKKGNIFKPE